MKWATMQPRERRTVVAGGGVALLALFIVWGVRPYHAALADARDQLASQSDALSRERAALGTALQNPRLQHIADSAMQMMNPRLFQGSDDVMASAELASYLGDVAQRSRVWLQDASTRPPVVGADGVRTLQVEIRAESDLRGVLRFLQALDRGDKLTRVDRMDVLRAPHTSADDASETLLVTATISGFAVGRPPVAAPARTAAALPQPVLPGAGSGAGQ
jgi:hypothetical protein